LGVVRQRKL